MIADTDTRIDLCMIVAEIDKADVLLELLRHREKLSEGERDAAWRDLLERINGIKERLVNLI